MKKILPIILFVVFSVTSGAETWIHSQIEYLAAIPQTQSTYSGETAEDIKQGIETEIFHNVKFLPNIKFDLYQNNKLKMNSKILYYSSYLDSFHLDFGGGMRGIRFLGNQYDYGFLMGRIKTNVINNVYGSFTYNYELDGKIDEYLVDVNYRVSRGFPMTLGFQYKSSEMKIPSTYKTEGLYLKLGILF